MSVIFEVILTFFLITVILASATNHSIVGHNAAVAVGGAQLRSMGYLADQSAGFDEPRAIPRVLGGLLAVALAWLLRGGTTQEAVETAGGK